jgi:hypothetical protein
MLSKKQWFNEYKEDLVLLYKKLEGSTKTESQKAVTKQNDTS